MTDRNQEYLVVHVAPAGTSETSRKTGKDTTSIAGHMWFTLTDSVGVASDYGFAPDVPNEGSPFAPGDVYRDDGKVYKINGENAGKIYSSRQVPITHEQYLAIESFTTSVAARQNPAFGAFGINSYYHASRNSCVDFVWFALKAGGLNPKAFEGGLLPALNVRTLEEAIDQYLRVGHPATAPPLKINVAPDGTPLSASGGGHLQTQYVISDAQTLITESDANGVVVQQTLRASADGSTVAEMKRFAAGMTVYDKVVNTNAAGVATSIDVTATARPTPGLDNLLDGVTAHGTVQYDDTGVILAQTLTQRHGDGSSAIYGYDAGTRTTTFRTENATGQWTDFTTMVARTGEVLNERWTTDDGSHGEISAQADNTHERTSSHADGKTVTTRYDAGTRTHTVSMTTASGKALELRPDIADPSVMVDGKVFAVSALMSTSLTPTSDTSPIVLDDNGAYDPSDFMHESGTRERFYRWNDGVIDYVSHSLNFANGDAYGTGSGSDGSSSTASMTADGAQIETFRRADGSVGANVTDPAVGATLYLRPERLSVVLDGCDVDMLMSSNSLSLEIDNDSGTSWRYVTEIGGDYLIFDESARVAGSFGWTTVANVEYNESHWAWNPQPTCPVVLQSAQGRFYDMGRGGYEIGLGAGMSTVFYGADLPKNAGAAVGDFWVSAVEGSGGDYRQDSLGSDGTFSAVYSEQGRVYGTSWLVNNAMATSVSDAGSYEMHLRNPDGSLNNEYAVVYSPDGSATMTSYDAQSGLNVATSVNAWGQTVRTVSMTTDPTTGVSTEEALDFNEDGSVKDRTLTKTRGDGRIVEIARDTDGDGAAEETERIVKREDGSVASDTTTATVDGGVMVTADKDSDGDGIVDRFRRLLTRDDGVTVDDLRVLNPDGTPVRETWTTTSVDGLTVDVQRDTNADGIVEQRERTVKDADGGKTVDLQTLNADGSLARETWTTASADGLTVDIQRDTNADGIVEQREHTVKDGDGGKTVDLQKLNADGSLMRETWTTTSADGTTVLIERDSNGDGTIEQEEFVVRDDQGVRVYIENYDAAGMLTSASTKTTSADGLTVLTERDTNGDGAIEQSTLAVTAADGGRSNDVRNFSADGSLKSEVLTTTAADGSQTGRYALAASGAQTLDGGGNRLAVGTAGKNALAGNDAATLIIGSAGNDTMTLGSGTNVIAFDVGDGKDTVRASAGEHNVLSLGGALTPDALSFSKSGNALVLGVGEDDSISFRDWFVSPENRRLATLQLIIDEAPGMTEELRTRTVGIFDFQALADGFEQARAADPALQTWQLSIALLDASLGAGNTAALGGDLAYQYAVRGNLSGMDIGAATAVLADTQFGRSARAVSPWGAISGGAAQLC